MEAIISSNRAPPISSTPVLQGSVPQQPSCLERAYTCIRDAFAKVVEFFKSLCGFCRSASAPAAALGASLAVVPQGAPSAQLQEGAATSVGRSAASVSSRLQAATQNIWGSLGRPLSQAYVSFQVNASHGNDSNSRPALITSTSSAISSATPAAASQRELLTQLQKRVSRSVRELIEADFCNELNESAKTEKISPSTVAQARGKGGLSLRLIRQDGSAPICFSVSEERLAEEVFEKALQARHARHPFQVGDQVQIVFLRVIRGESVYVVDKSERTFDVREGARSETRGVVMILMSEKGARACVSDHLFGGEKRSELPTGELNLIASMFSADSL